MDAPLLAKHTVIIIQKGLDLYFLEYQFSNKFHPPGHRTYNECTYDVQKKCWTSSERLMYVQFTSCVQEDYC